MVEVHLTSLGTRDKMLESSCILLLGEDGAQANVIKNALEQLGVTSPLLHFDQSDKALAHLRLHVEKPPWLILLSVSIAETHSIEFLKTLKSEKALKLIPVVLMASSYNQNFIIQSFRHGAAGHMVTSDDPSQIFDTIKAIVQYWTLSALPPTEN